MIDNLGDVNFLEYGALLMNQEESAFEILYCMPYSDTEDLYQFSICNVDITDSWINKQDVLDYMGMNEETYDPALFALGCIEYYGANYFGDVTDMNSEQVLEVLSSLGIESEVE